MTPTPGEVSRIVAAFYSALDFGSEVAARRMLAVLARAERDAQRAAARAAATAAEDAGGAFAAQHLARIADDVRAKIAALTPLLAAAAERGVEVAAEAEAAASRDLAGVWSGWGVSSDVVAAISATTSPGAPVRYLLDRVALDAAGAASDALATGVALGHNPRRIARDMVRAAHNLSTARALTIARTETLRAARAAQHRSIVANRDAVDGWVWVSTRDARTCPVCWAMHGTRHAVDETMAAHVNCRCRMVPLPHLPPEARDAFVAAIIGDPRPGQRGGTLPQGRGAPTAQSSPGEQAFARLPDATKRRLLGPARYALLMRGGVPLRRLVGYTESSVWGRSVHLRPLTDAERARARRLAA